MGIQDDAARVLFEALNRRQLNAVLGYGMEPSVTIRDYPGAVVYLTVDGLGGLLTKFVFDNRPPAFLNFVPTAAGAEALADEILTRIAGEGGGSPS